MSGSTVRFWFKYFKFLNFGANILGFFRPFGLFWSLWTGFFLKKCFEIGANKDIKKFQNLPKNRENCLFLVQILKFFNSTCPSDHFDVLNIKIGLAEHLELSLNKYFSSSRMNSELSIPTVPRGSITPILMYSTSK